MRRLPRLDAVLMLVLVPCWIAAFAIHLRQVTSGRLAWVPIFVSSPATSLDLPMVRGFWPGVRPEDTGLQLGDRLVHAGTTDLRGVGPVGVFARIEEQADEALRVRLDYLRGDVSASAVVALVPIPFPWRMIPLTLTFAVLAVFVMFRRPGTAVARAFFLAGLFFSLHWTLFFGGPRIQSYAWAATLLCSSLLMFPLMLRVPMLFPPEIVPGEGRLPRWPWVFGVLGPISLSYVFGFPFPPAVGRQGLFFVNDVFISALLAVLTRNYLRSGPIGRRQTKWVLYGIYVGTLPVLVADVATALASVPWWLHDTAAIAEALIPFSIAIAIIRFNLFDIDRLISGAALYSLLLVVLLASLPTLVLPSARFVSASIGLEQGSVQLVLSGLLATTLVWARNPVRPYVDRTFFPERYRLAGRMDRLLHELSEAHDPQALVRTAVAGLQELLEPAVCAAYARTSEAFIRVESVGGVHRAEAPSGFESTSALVAELQATARPLDLQGTRAAGGGETPARMASGALPGTVAVPVHRGELLACFLLLGEKRSGDVYTTTDLGFLAALGHSLSVELLRLDLERYTPSKLPEIIRRRPEELEPRTRMVSVLFSDIRDSTTIAERLPPAALRDLHQHYFGTMDEIIARHDGVLIKTIGDALMALWNAPESVADHAAGSCRAALDMLAALTPLNLLWREETGWPAIDVRMGIVSGEAVVGLFGTARHVEYDARGDAVNLASRLEGLNKLYRTRILLPDAARREIGDRFVCRPIDRVCVVGKTQPVEVYELLGLRTEDRDGRLARLAEAFEHIVAAYRRRAFDEATAVLELLARDQPDDGPTVLYLQRCRAYLATPPETGWEGVFEAVSK